MCVDVVMTLTLVLCADTDVQALDGDPMSTVTSSTSSGNLK